MKSLCVIPARYQSSRFPGKPLADIGGKPMVVRVYERVCDSFSDTVVATDDFRIRAACVEHGIRCQMTRINHATGTDRVAEVADQFPDFDVYVNVQGDEPFLPLESIDPIVEAVTPWQVSNGMAQIIDPDDVNGSIPKVVFNRYREAVYLSRVPIPGQKDGKYVTRFKQVCIYGFSRAALKRFQEWERGPLERIEDIEILRFIEHHYPVRMVEVPTGSIAVDTPADLVKAVAEWRVQNGVPRDHSRD